MRTVKTKLVIELLAVGGHHASLTRSDMFHGMEREYGTVGKTTVTTMLFLAFTVHEIAAGSMAGILYNPQAVLVGKLSELFQIQRIACKINRNNTFVSTAGSSLKHGFEFTDIHEVSILVNITEYHLAATIADAVGTGSKGHGSDNHLVARLYIQCGSCKMKPRSGIVHRYGILCTYIFGKFRFKFPDFGTLCQVIAFQGINDCPDILICDMLTTVWNRLAYHFTSKLGSTYFFIFSRIVSTVSHSVLLSLL